MINDTSQFSGLFMWLTVIAIVVGWFQKNS